MSSENLHVPREVLSQDARLLHYAITSLMEELAKETLKHSAPAVLDHEKSMG